MSTWALFVAAAAGLAVLTTWHAIAKTKAASEALLNEYTNLLAESRRRMAAAQEQAESEKPGEVSEAADQGPSQ